MKNIILLLSLVLLFSCNKLIEKPEHLISKKKITNILVDIAINEQSNIVNPKSNMEIETRYILKKHNISSKAFNDSYEYYVLKKDLPGIIEDAQDLLIKKYPGLEEKLKSRDSIKLKNKKSINDFSTIKELPSLNKLKNSKANSELKNKLKK